MAIVTRTFGVFELDSGSSFNGEYIDHEFETNWYYGPTPAQFMQVQAVRMHGLSYGQAELNLAIKGVQNDMHFNQDYYSTSRVPLNLPKNAAALDYQMHDATVRADISGRGLAVQFKVFSSKDYADNPFGPTPEPAHVCQALTIYASPEGAYDH